MISLSLKALNTFSKILLKLITLILLNETESNLFLQYFEIQCFCLLFKGLLCYLKSVLTQAFSLALFFIEIHCLKVASKDLFILIVPYLSHV